MSENQNNIIYNLLCDWYCEICDEAIIGTSARGALEIVEEIEKILTTHK